MDTKHPSKKSPSKTAAPKKVTPKKAAPKKNTSQKSLCQKTAPKKVASKASKSPAQVPKKKSIAQKTAARWRFFRSNLFRWLLMIPLAGIWYIFTFLMAGYSFTALVCLCLIGILLFYNVCEWTKRKFPKTTKVVKSVFTILLCIGLLVVGITEILIIHASFGDKTETCEYMVVLGAKVRHDGPSVSLMDRIRAAADYMNTHPDVIAVVSGGKGGDEPMTEAQCMYNELVKLGIDPNRIWMEENATSTWENLHFSLNLIEEKTGSRPDKIGLLSSEYHLFRAKMFAKACEVEAVGIPAHTSRLSQMINHFMREVAGVWHYIILGGQYSD